MLKLSGRRNKQVGITEEENCHSGEAQQLLHVFIGRDETFHYFLQLVSARCEPRCKLTHFKRKSSAAEHPRKDEHYLGMFK